MNSRTNMVSIAVLRMILLFGAVAVLGVEGVAAGIEMPRISLLNFVCEDNSYRSTAAAAEMTAGVQAELSSKSGIQWVERVELQKIEEEQHLAGLGLIDKNEAIQQGRMAKADWVVIGNISTNRSNARRLGLEIVDLHTADVLASTNLGLASDTSSHFQFDSSQVEDTAAALGPLIDRARGIQSQISRSRTVAILSFSGVSEISGMQNLKEDLRNELNSQRLDGKRVHVIQFRNPEQASDEATLVLSGLTSAYPKTDVGIADVFVWASLTKKEHLEFDKDTRKPVKIPVFQIALNVWDGNGQPIESHLSRTNLTDSINLAHELARRICGAFAAGPGSVTKPEIPHRLSEALTDQAFEYVRQARGFRNLRHGNELWHDVVEMLETARFLDPENQRACELCTRIRWNRLAEAASPNRFFFARRKSDAWKKYVSQFGNTSTIATETRAWGMTNSIATESVLSAWQPFEMFKFSQYTQSNWGVPRDAGGDELRNWQRQFGDDFYSRLLAAPLDPAWIERTPDFLYGVFAMNGDIPVFEDAKLRQRVLEFLWPSMLKLARTERLEFDDAYRRGFSHHFQSIGHPGRDDQLIAQLDAIHQQRVAESRRKPVVLPRAADIFTNLPPENP